jgi:hypothetical protein
MNGKSQILIEVVALFNIFFRNEHQPHGTGAAGIGAGTASRCGSIRKNDANPYGSATLGLTSQRFSTLSLLYQSIMYNKRRHFV